LSGSITPHILHIPLDGNGQLHDPAAIPPGQKPMVLTEYRTGWDPESVLKHRRVNKSLNPGKNLIAMKS
jgi:hypothetical protein